MPRYFLHLWDGDLFEEDEEGTDLPDGARAGLNPLDGSAFADGRHHPPHHSLGGQSVFARLGNGTTVLSTSTAVSSAALVARSDMAEPGLVSGA
jgi:hypothetical protein